MNDSLEKNLEEMKKEELKEIRKKYTYIGIIAVLAIVLISITFLYFSNVGISIPVKIRSAENVEIISEKRTEITEELALPVTTKKPIEIQQPKEMPPAENITGINTDIDAIQNDLNSILNTL